MEIIDIRETSEKILPELYLEVLHDNLGQVKEPHIIVDDDKVFYVAHDSHQVGIVEKDTKIPRCKTISFGENIRLGDIKLDAVNVYDDGQLLYHIPQSNIDKVMGTNKKSKNHFILSTYYENYRGRDDNTLVFAQDIKDKRVEFKYDVTNIESIISKIAYCLNFDPSEINRSEYKEYLLVLGRFINKNYKLNKITYRYHRSPICIHHSRYNDSSSDTYHGYSFKSYSVFELLESIENDGFYREVPKDVASLIIGENEAYNKILKLASCYNEKIKK